jgi:hypothetical protein
VEAAGCFDAAQYRHAYIHEDYIRLELKGHLEGLQPIGRLANHLNARLHLKQAGQSLSYNGGIIGEQHAGSLANDFSGLTPWSELPLDGLINNWRSGIAALHLETINRHGIPQIP